MLPLLTSQNLRTDHVVSPVSCVNSSVLASSRLSSMAAEVEYCHCLVLNISSRGSSHIFQLSFLVHIFAASRGLFMHIKCPFFEVCDCFYADLEYGFCTNSTLQSLL